MEKPLCYHCGDYCDTDIVEFDDKSFCCHGCKTVFEILQTNDLTYYYKLATNPGNSPRFQEGKFNFLNNQEIVDKLLDFKDDNYCIVNFIIPSIHCSSCIWVLENLSKMHPGILSTVLNFPSKTLTINFKPKEISLKQIAELITSIGYEPSVSLQDETKELKKSNKDIIYKLGIAGFAFGNIMFLSFPEYFEVNEFWLDQFKPVFRWIMLVFSLPVVFYAGWDYFKSAFKGLKSGILNIDVPIAIGILVLFLRSSVDIIFDFGSGFFDSLSGLVFFLLVGKFFQQKTYAYLSFERDYKSYFPIGVTKLESTPNTPIKELQIELRQVKADDVLLIRNGELLPVDAEIIKGQGLIDYSFVTGESLPVVKQIGDKVFAGGRQQSGAIEVKVLKALDQSYLTQLWENQILKKSKPQFQNFTDSISQRFTIIILSIAIVSFVAWLLIDASQSLNVLTAVLIVACPCAIALSAPFTLGNLLRIYGRHGFYLKDGTIIERLAKVNHIVFDKTGTLTSNENNIIEYKGIELTESEKDLLSSSLRASNHPLSRLLY
ncbi:heavy metal translocating P-type ATPase, partial [Aegicerativicinus sediminis]